MIDDVVEEDREQDAALHLAWQGGDHRAAVVLVRRYRTRLIGLGRRKGLSVAEAEELAQDVLMAAPYSKFEARDNATYWNWLAKIADRKVARMLARREGVALPRRHTTPWSAALRQRLFEDIEGMSATQREVLMLTFVGCGRREIAVKLGVQPVTVGMRIYRGRRWLRARGH